jgi:AcrR family transcriptional regulator
MSLSTPLSASRKRAEKSTEKSDGKRASKRASNRDAILIAARQVFTEQGYGGTTVRDIIRRTELASGTFYNYFDSKEAVFEALSIEVGEDLRRRLAEARARATTFEDFIECCYLTYFTYYADNPLDHALMRSNRGRQGENINMQGPQVKAGLAEMREDIERAMATGMVGPVDVAYLTAAIGGVAFAILDQMMDSAKRDPHAAAQFAAQLILGGINAKK